MLGEMEMIDNSRIFSAPLCLIAKMSVFLTIVRKNNLDISFYGPINIFMIFNILSLSGGGFRGLYTAQVLACLEKEAGRPLAQCFDLICGTSIGGILAMALALEKPAQEILSLMEEQGPKIFPTPPKQFSYMAYRYRFLKSFCKAKFKNDNLKIMVEKKLFQDHTLADSRHRLLIPAFNYERGEPQFFKTHHHKDFYRDHERKMADIAMATSAAPVIFPIYPMSDTNFCYVDGGLVGNAPGLFGVHEATHFLEKDVKDIHLLSIGTMGGNFCRDASLRLNRGIISWREDLFLLTISAQEKVAHFMLQHQLGDRYYLIDKPPNSTQEKNIGLDIASKAAIETLKGAGEASAQEFVDKIRKKEITGFLSHEAEPFQPPSQSLGENL